MKPLNFSDNILLWYNQNKRDLPWRFTTDPYKIWISEVILQQTRVEQGTNYYINFIKKFPSIYHLANASEDEVLKLWQGLGYYSRARNLHFAAKQIVNNFDGIFPTDSTTLKNIKGIGEYTSAAIASIAFNEPIAVVDGNVYRVLSRLFDIDIPIDSTKGIKHYQTLANKYLDINKPGDYNQAIMEFGALQCKPKSPSCEICVFRSKCLAFKNKTILLRPHKQKKTKITKRYFNYIVIEDKHHVLFNKREKNDIWQNMYDFPLIETTKNLSIEDLSISKEWNTMFNKQPPTVSHISKNYKHVLSHQHIHAKFIHISIKNEKKYVQDFIKIDKRNIFDLAVPKIIENYLIEMGFVK